MQVTQISPYEKTSDMQNISDQTAVYFSWIIRTGIFVISGLGFWYLILLNSLATSAFALEGLKSERIQIQRELEQWEIELAIPTSLYALESSEQVQSMEDITKKIYIEVNSGEVAFIESSLTSEKNEQSI